MNLSDYMGGRGLWKFNSMGGGVEKKVPSSPPQVFFSGIALNAYHNDSKFCHRCVLANSADPDQTASRGAVLSGSTLFAIVSEP